MLVKAGTTLVLSVGNVAEDFTFEPLIVLKDFDQATVAKEFDSCEDNDPNSFADWLGRKGLVEPTANLVQWWLGDSRHGVCVSQESSEQIDEPNTSALKI